MPGSKVKTSRERALQAMKTPPPRGAHFVWDGKNEDERPLTAAEMRAGMALAKKRGRPPLAGPRNPRRSALMWMCSTLSAAPALVGSHA